MNNSLFKKSFENWKCESNPQNADVDNLTFDYDQSSITVPPKDRINDNFLELSNSSLIVHVYLKWIFKKKFTFNWLIDWWSKVCMWLFIDQNWLPTYTLRCLYVCLAINKLYIKLLRKTIER